MLTTVRPDTNEEDTFFSRWFFLQNMRSINPKNMNRLVELDKLKQLSRKQERKEAVSKNSKLCNCAKKVTTQWLQLARVEDPDIVVIMPSSSKGGIMEKYIKVFFNRNSKSDQNIIGLAHILANLNINRTFCKCSGL